MLEKLRELSEEIVIRTEKDTKYGTAIVRTPTPVIKLDKAIEFFKELEEKLEISEKALELACDCFYNNFAKVLEPYCGCNTSSEAMRKHFKTKAKEMKSE